MCYNPNKHGGQPTTWIRNTVAIGRGSFKVFKIDVLFIHPDG